MKKETVEPKSRKKLLINIGLVIFTIAISLSIGYFLILPIFSQLTEINQSIATEKNHAEKIGQSISSLKNQDKAVIAEIADTFEALVPAQIDMLHFASLNETIARNVGAEVISITLSKIAPPKSSKTKVVANQVSSLAIIGTYKSNFDSLLNLIRAWLRADQEVGVKTIQISGDTSGVVSYTVTYDLPTSKTAPTATIDDQLSLSKKQLNEMLAIKSKIIYTATPSAKPLGSSNPFQ